MRYIVFLWLLATPYSLLAQANVPACPAGQIWSGEACVVHFYCKDGRPLLPGKKCNQASVRSPDISVPLPQGEDLPCSRKAQFFNHKLGGPELRTVIFSNGAADRLFERYVLESGEAGVKVDLRKIRVIFFEKTRGRLVLDAPRLKLGEMFKFLTPRKLWSQELKGLWAQKIIDPQREAMRLKADLICGN